MVEFDKVSLAQIRALQTESFKGTNDEVNPQESPTIDELTQHLFFSPADGRIWLNDQRMLLLHSQSIGLLRRELVDSLGGRAARGLLTRMGYLSGTRDASFVRQKWQGADPKAVFLAGAKLHGLEGAVRVELVSFEYDADEGRYEGEFLWHFSSEADEHIESYGIDTHPACWMEVGYAIGYVSGLLGSLVIFREVECRAMGHATCRVIGKSANLWPDIEEDMQYLNASGLGSSPSSAATQGLDERAASMLSAQMDSESDDSLLVGISAAYTSAHHALTKVAPTQATVLFQGESGVGKEVFARQLHELSAVRKGPFIGFNCAAIPENLLESELFGVEKGAYTGANASRPGRFERAQGGTLFLDEVGHLSFAGQGKLLRALQERKIERVGGSREVHVDVRVVAATNVDLRSAVQRGEFREDLFFRLNVYPITLPPLRERRSDIPLLIERFFKHFCEQHQRFPEGISYKATQVLMQYPYPGNIRELQNIIERGVISSEDGGMVELSHLFRNEKMPEELVFSVSGKGGLVHQETVKLHQTSMFDQLSNDQNALDINALEAQILREALQKTEGNLTQAAKRVGLTRAQFAYRLDKHGIKG